MCACMHDAFMKGEEYSVIFLSAIREFELSLKMNKRSKGNYKLFLQDQEKEDQKP